MCGGLLHRLKAVRERVGVEADIDQARRTCDFSPEVQLPAFHSPNRTAGS